MKKKVILFTLVTAFAFLNSCSLFRTVNRPHSVINDTTQKQLKESPSFNFEITEDVNKEKFIVSIDNPLTERLFITIKCPDQGVYSENTSKRHFHKRYDMSVAEDGEYLIIVSNCKETISKILRLTTITEITRQITMK